VAGFADIWHSFEPLDEFHRKNDLLKRYTEGARRDESDIERAVAWKGPAEADLYHKDGVNLFTAHVKPTEKGYGLSVLSEMITWRDGLSHG